MKSIKAIKDFTLDGVPYEKDDIVEIKNINQVVKLNEKGFITPLTAKDLYNIRKELSVKNFEEKEVE